MQKIRFKRPNDMLKVQKNNACSTMKMQRIVLSKMAKEEYVFLTIKYIKKDKCVLVFFPPE